jgi:predicted ester cyclase
VKQAAELFRNATPGRHVIVDQLAEGDRVVTRIRGHGKHTGDAIHRIWNGKITEHWALVDMATFLQQTGVLPSQEG